MWKRRQWVALPVFGSRIPGFERCAEANEHAAVIEPHFVQDRRNMLFHSAWADSERIGDLRVGEALHKEWKDLLFAS